jgi:tellurite methyltransferase
MKLKAILYSSVLVLISLIVLYSLDQGKWDRYYRNKLGQPPSKVIVKALNLNKTPGKAIDIGFGAGNEVVFMLNSGWQVWAVDKEPKAIKVVNRRKDINDSTPLFAFSASFEDSATWDMLPEVDFIGASYALPFCKPDNFLRVWNHIKHKLSLEGRFAGHFFGVNYQGFSSNEMQEMSFLTKEEILLLLQDFEIEHFQEIEEDGLSGTGKPIHSHVFEVIIRKIREKRNA